MLLRYDLNNENETRTVILANAQPERVFKTVGLVVVPQEKSESKQAFISTGEARNNERMKSKQTIVSQTE